jgi:hypothetical protein
MRDRTVGHYRICADRDGRIYPQERSYRGCDLHDSSRSRRKNSTSRPDDRVGLRSSCRPRTLEREKKSQTAYSDDGARLEKLELHSRLQIVSCSRDEETQKPRYDRPSSQQRTELLTDEHTAVSCGISVQFTNRTANITSRHRTLSLKKD